MGKIKILIADDHPMVLEGITRLLEGMEGEVIGIAEDGQALVEAARRLRPNLILVDISMPVLNGLEAARQIKTFVPNCKIIFLTMHADPTYAREAFEAGGSGYLLKRSAAAELQEAMRSVLAGGRYLTPLIDHEGLGFSGRSLSKGVHQFGKLTSRQREVLQLLAEGHSTKEIASILAFFIKTAEFHKTTIREALDLHSIGELTQYSISYGLIESPSASSLLSIPRDN